jgi:hypothetical protein
LVKTIGNVRSELVELKSIPIWDQFFKVTFDTIGSLLETKHGNSYVLVAIDHYSKWCEAKAVMDNDVETAAKFLKNEIICKLGVPNYILTDNGIECSAKFDQICKNYNIAHQFTTLQWSR